MVMSSLVVIMAVTTRVVPVFVPVATSLTPMTLTLTTLLLFIALTHPLFLYKIHRLTTSVVTMAMLFPVSLMPRGNVKINWLGRHRHWLWNHNDRLWTYQDRLRIISNIDAPIHARLVNAYRHANSSLGPSRVSAQKSHQRDHTSKIFHHHGS